MTHNTAARRDERAPDDRRRALRARAPIGMGVRFPGLLDAAVVDDISSSGVCCRTAQPIPLLRQVQLVLLLPIGGTTREVVCAGAVVRCAASTDAAHGSAAHGGERRESGTTEGQVGSSRDGPRHGLHETAIFFTEIDDSDRTALDEYVSSLHRARTAG